MLGRKSLRQSHPLNSPPFEVFCDGSWHGVDQVKVKDGSLCVEINHNEIVVEEKINGEDLRLRSRKASAFDCGRFLKAGVDVCVLAAHPLAAASEKGQQPLFAWHDAKIASIKRTVHDDRCACLFSVIFQTSKDSSNVKTSNHGRGAETVRLDNISILQKLKTELCDDVPDQWNSSVDCASATKSKLLNGEFSSEVSWLVVLSAVRGMEFEIKVIDNRIVHHVTNDSRGLQHADLDGEIAIMGFRKSNRKWFPKTETLALSIPKEITTSELVVELDRVDDMANSDSDVEILYERKNLRHSKRRKVLPDRFVPMFKRNGCQDIVLSDLSMHGENGSFPSQLGRGRPKLLSASECKEMIESCMVNIRSAIENEIQPLPLESVASRSKNILAIEEFNWNPSRDNQAEEQENEELWNEMEHSLTTLALLEQKQGFGSELPNFTADVSDTDEEQECCHDYKLDEQIGLICCICKSICTEIRYVSLPFGKNEICILSNEKGWKQEFDWVGPYILGSDCYSNRGSSLDVRVSFGFDNVWTLIPEYQTELHVHQKRAFEFIWRNIAGSLNPQEMNAPAAKTGGCVISHSPGSGKTLLVISFLVSYLKINPRCRPLVLAPKIATYTWCKEFKKWGVSIPIHQILPIESFKKPLSSCKLGEFSPDNRRPSKKMMHVMDCLLKLKKWHEEPSVLLLSYSSFFSLTQEDSKLEYRKFVAGVLQKSPGILILDEGHNPRSTTSKLRKLLMKVKTEFRILLSGTLFQNNFEEYFNSLALARPRFIRDITWDLDPDMVNVISSRRRKHAKKSSQVERLARKLFVENVGQKIESNFEKDRRSGFNLLNRLTSEFVDTYDGDRFDMLPGLQIYTIMLESTDIQREILMKVTKIHHEVKHKRCPLELELLITVGSIHPWLIKRVACVSNFFSDKELEKVERYKGNFRSGSKVSFVVDLVHKSTIRGEKVLVFCHNIPPISMFAEVLESTFGWHRGEEILVLQGDQELSLREKVMDQFNGDVKGKCKVLLASTTACAEGVSLTAASRVVLVDSEWNHSKTRQAIARAFRPGQERVVYVYRLLASGTYEEDKYDTNSWKAWLSKMIFIGQYIRYPSSRQVEDIEDEVLRELAEEDQRRTIQMVMKHD